MATRKCPNCKKAKPLTDFNRKGNYADGSVRYQPYCKLCNAEKSRAYYAANRALHIQNQRKNKKRYIERNRSHTYKWLLQHPCVDCGEKNPVKLDFDHLRDKIDHISALVGRPTSLKKLKSEIAKCVSRCANCHRIKTAKEQNWWILREYKKRK